MRCIGQVLESLKTFCVVRSLPNPVEQKSYDVINNKFALVMKEVAKEGMKRAAVEENSSSPDNLLTVSGDDTCKTRGHSSLIGVCTSIGVETVVQQPIVDQDLLCLDLVHATLGPVVHEQMFRSGGQSDAKPPELSSQESLGLLYRPTEWMKG
ncbi:hypothetical protein TNCV_136851 [Trichonephila clavipes]|nr:hypothetical protein TNCV_136851 [Trichonephila clavipes]